MSVIVVASVAGGTSSLLNAISPVIEMLLASSDCFGSRDSFVCGLIASIDSSTSASGSPKS
jgi:hypothetical protein